jgi:hypothetical protein
MSERKIGAGHFGAMVRLGLKELRNLANPSRESVADNEIGLYGTLTQGEIAKARGGPGQGLEQESPDGKLSLDELRGEAQQRAKDNERGREDGQQREQDRGLER